MKNNQVKTDKYKLESIEMLIQKKGLKALPSRKISARPLRSLVRMKSIKGFGLKPQAK